MTCNIFNGQESVGDANGLWEEKKYYANSNAIFN